MDTLLDSLRTIPLFSQCSEAELTELITHAPAKLRQYASGDIIARQGATIYSLPILIQGSVRGQMMGADGKRLTMDTLHAPSVLASAFVFSSEGKFPAAVEAIEPSAVWHLDKEYLLSYMSHHPAVMRAYLGMISDRCSFLSHKINTLNLQSLRERILSHMYQEGQIGNQSDLALLLGVTRPALARVLGELTEEGLILRKADGYHLPS